MLFRRSCVASALVVLLTACCFGDIALATTYYWDTTAGNMTGGSGNWSLSNSNLSVSTTGDATLSAWTASGTDSAYFSTGSGTATVAVDGVTANNVTFNAGTAYAINGPGMLSVGTAGIATNASATINAPVYIAASQSWTTSAGRTITFNSAISGPAASYPYYTASQLTLRGIGNAILRKTRNTICVGLGDMRKSRAEQD